MSTETKFRIFAWLVTLYFLAGAACLLLEVSK